MAPHPSHLTPHAAAARLRFALLGSGSRGNAAVVECGDTRILLDCGFSARETLVRLGRLGRDGAGFAAILITHEHSDHAAGAAVCARRLRAPVWMTPGTFRALGSEADGLADVRLFNPDEAFVIGDIEVRPFPVPHDAREPSQFVFSDGQARLGFLTDIGEATAEVEAMLDGCDALVLECNHDPGLLRDGPYPYPLKQRIAGGQGHLANQAAAELLARLDTSRLRHLVAAHLSQTNNRPELVRAALSRRLGCDPDWVQVADQQRGLSWVDCRVGGN